MSESEAKHSKVAEEEGEGEVAPPEPKHNLKVSSEDIVWPKGGKS